MAGFLGLGSLAASADTYTVQSGDTVANIAASHNDTVNGIASRNNLSNVNLIFVGQQLEVGQNTTSNNTQAAATTTATTTQAQSTPVASTTNATTSYNTAAQNTNTASANTANTSSSSNYGTGSHAAVLSQMEARTGVSASTWNYIINRESNWQSSVRNSTSGAYGLFQNMHISGGSVQDQIDAAVSLYNQQGMAAWSM
ncbi:LysM peptidoglycan-binding domain-containing protein [Lentilactobacillus senioris]|nr:LysM peptidoglycan-binding domain-containing protein [Lentilactobacillus senioris]MCY9806265.1 LysM peptidoglycan-binding domain-containing protein [Lentilactobacillus senioris]